MQDLKRTTMDECTIGVVTPSLHAHSLENGDVMDDHWLSASSMW